MQQDQSIIDQIWDCMNESVERAANDDENGLSMQASDLQNTSNWQQSDTSNSGENGASLQVQDPWPWPPYDESEVSGLSSGNLSQSNGREKHEVDPQRVGRCSLEVEHPTLESLHGLCLALVTMFTMVRSGLGNRWNLIQWLKVSILWLTSLATGSWGSLHQ